MKPSGFVPPTYPYDRLRPLADAARSLPGGLVDLSIGDPYDPPPAAVIAALASSGAERNYPSGVGSARLLGAARAWIARRFGVELGAGEIAACIGTKEFVAGIPHWLKLRDPSRDTVLYPEISYPTYAMGAVLGGCRPVAVPARPDGTLDLGAIAADDCQRALCLWVNSPSNPSGALDDLGAAAAFGRLHGIPVLSDECYAEFTWDGPPRTILEHGLEGVLAVHSISKRSNCAGLRVGVYAGDPSLVHYLSELRRHAGFMIPGPVQLAGAVALEDDEHVAVQRARYAERLGYVAATLEAIGIAVVRPGGAFYLWVEAPERFEFADAGTRPDNAPSESAAWRLARQLAMLGGALVSPGEFYGDAGVGHVRVAMVQPLDRLELVARRLGVVGPIGTTSAAAGITR